MYDVSRRAFLIGGGVSIGAALTASKVGLAANFLKGVQIGRAVIPNPVKSKYYDILIGSAETPRDATVRHIFYRNAMRYPLMDISVNSRAAFRWVACPGAEFIFKPEDVLIYEIESAQGLEDRFIMCLYSQTMGESYCHRLEWDKTKLTKMNHTILGADGDSVVLNNVTHHIGKKSA